MEIRLAVRDDLMSILKIIDDAKAYFKSQHIDQWQNGYPNKQSILEDILAGHSYVLCDDKKIVATAAIIFENDPNYDFIEDGQWLSSGPYGVLHRIACDPSYKGQGFASLFFDYAKARANIMHYASLRVDTHQDNLSMQRLIAKNKFHYCGIVYMEDGSSRYAYEYVLEREKEYEL